jgi:DNA-binding transcriptional regulator YdaS (Cro superfamily)
MTTVKKTTAKRTTAKKTAARSASSRRIADPDGAVVWEKLDRLIGILGNNRVAAFLGVSKSQPSRWRSGEERIGPENARRVNDLEYVISRLRQVYPESVAQTWLMSQNAYLGGRPADVLKLRGVGPVIAAVDAEEEGAFA